MGRSDARDLGHHLLGRDRGPLDGHVPGPPALLALLAGLFLVGLAIRLPNVPIAPELTDEWEEMVLGYDAYRGHLHLIGAEPYIGALYTYLLAACFAVA